MQGFELITPCFSSLLCAEMAGEVCSLQGVVGVQIEAMIYDMCCKQSLSISQRPVRAQTQRVGKDSFIRSSILHLAVVLLANIRSRQLLQYNNRHVFL